MIFALYFPYILAHFCAAMVGVELGLILTGTPTWFSYLAAFGIYPVLTIYNVNTYRRVVAKLKEMEAK